MDKPILMENLHHYNGERKYTFGSVWIVAIHLRVTW